MNEFRTSVTTILNGDTPPLPLIPAVEPPKQAGGMPGRPTLHRGSKGELVKQIQLKLHTEADGNFGPKTEAELRVFQRNHNLIPDGIVGPKTLATLDTV